MSDALPGILSREGEGESEAGIEESMSRAARTRSNYSHERTQFKERKSTDWDEISMKLFYAKAILICYIEIFSKSIIITISNGFIFPFEEVKMC